MMEIELRALEKKDAFLMLEWMHDRNVTCYLKLDGKNATMESVLAFIENAQNQMDNLHYAIVNKEDDYLGTISLKNIDFEKKEAELAIVLHTCAMGKGVATKAIQALLKIAEEKMNLDRIYLNVLRENQRACKLYEKLHFQYIETTSVEINGKGNTLDWYEYKY